MATSYTKTNWQDAPSTATPITAAQLNRMEKGIEDCSGQGNANELAIAANAEAIRTLESGIQLGSISITQLLLMAHPIGSIYSSTVATSPADLFGGTWERIKDTFLLAAGSTYAAGATGGEATHTLTEAELASHIHQIKSDGGAKTHLVATNGSGSDGPDYSFDDSSHDYDGNISGSFYATATGGNQPHNNMPPYLAVYVWKRTA